MNYDPNATADKHHLQKMQAKSEIVAMLRHINAEYSKKSLVLKSSTILAVSIVFVSAPEENASPLDYIMALFFMSFFYILDGYYRKVEHLAIERIGYINADYGVGLKLSDLSQLLREKIPDQDSRFYSFLNQWSEKSLWFAPSLLLFYCPILTGVIFYIGKACFSYVPPAAS